MSFSLGPSAVVGTLYYKDLEPPVSTIEERFTADTAIEKDKVVMLKQNGKVEAVTGNDALSPAFPVAPYQAYDGTGTGPGDYPSPMYISASKVLFGYEDSGAKTLNFRYAEVSKTSSPPFDFPDNPIVLYPAGTTNIINQSRFIFDELNASQSEARGVVVWNETGGTPIKTGTWIAAWSFDIGSRVASFGTPFSLFPTTGYDADAVFLTDTRLCVLQANNRVNLMTVDWNTRILTLQVFVFADPAPIPTFTFPQITKVVDGTDYYIQSWYVTGSPLRPKCTPQKVDLATNSFTFGTSAVATPTSSQVAINKTPRDNKYFYPLMNLSSPGLGSQEWVFDKDTNTMTAGVSSFSLSAGAPNAIEYLQFIPPGGGPTKNYLVWFSAAYIVNYPAAGYYDLDTASNFASTIVTSAPGEPGGMAVLQQDLDIVLAWLGSGDARCALCDLGDRTTNLNADRIIGVAKDSGAIGDNIRVELLGSVAVVDTLETLVPLSDVYVEADGKITQTKNIGDVKIGKALSATKILLTTTPEEF